MPIEWLQAVLAPDEFFVAPVVVKQLDHVVKRYFPAFVGS
jgi:hypothetical protein